MQKHKVTIKVEADINAEYGIDGARSMAHSIVAEALHRSNHPRFMVQGIVVEPSSHDCSCKQPCNA